jgi:hypothetical protein
VFSATIRVTASAVASVTVEEAFRFVTTIENHPRWHRRAIATLRWPDAPLTLGSEWWASVRSVGTNRPRVLHLRVTEWELDQRFVSWTSSLPYEMGSGYEFGWTEGGAWVNCIREVKLPWRLRPAAPLFRRILERDIALEAHELQRELNRRAGYRRQTLVEARQSWRASAFPLEDHSLPRVAMPQPI